ncbi:hypothetical protein CEXT_585751 [Caerostris extrusa]|uniref:Uncharacterized protein n=1 Tax=Caerostris extrusa TaxID=172846 RepID=A0AAV4WI85_CAEEX|nr:hypothetical protein CEXT_585751 [Caerostris extrusa]
MKLKADAKSKTSSEMCEKKSQIKETLSKQTGDEEKSGSKILNSDEKHTSYEPMTSPKSEKEEENLEAKILRSPDTKLFNQLGEERSMKLKTNLSNLFA